MSDVRNHRSSMPLVVIVPPYIEFARTYLKGGAWSTESFLSKITRNQYVRLGAALSMMLTWL